MTSTPTFNESVVLCHILEELALGGTGVSHDADVDVPSQRRPLHGRLGNASKQHQQDATLDLIVACPITDSDSVLTGKNSQLCCP